MSNRTDGRINLIIGCMYSGKTSELISRYNKYLIGGKKCIMVKPLIDNRYDEDHVVTHDGNKIKALSTKLLGDVVTELLKYDVICVDEVQFVSDVIVVSEQLANQGKIIELCGLSGTYKREPFDIISNLIPKCENVTFKKAICKNTGGKATFTKRIVDIEGDVLIGGNNYYTAVDRATYFSVPQ